MLLVIITSAASAFHHHISCQRCTGSDTLRGPVLNPVLGARVMCGKTVLTWQAGEEVTTLYTPTKQAANVVIVPDESQV